MYCFFTCFKVYVFSLIFSFTGSSILILKTLYNVFIVSIWESSRVINLDLIIRIGQILYQVHLIYSCLWTLIYLFLKSKVSLHYSSCMIPYAVTTFLNNMLEFIPSVLKELLNLIDWKVCIKLKPRSCSYAPSCKHYLSHYFFLFLIMIKQYDHQGILNLYIKPNHVIQFH